MSIALAAVWIALFCCLTIVAVTWIDSRANKRAKRGQPVDPEQILAERFARGELDEREYAARLSALRIGPPLHAYLEP